MVLSTSDITNIISVLKTFPAIELVYLFGSQLTSEATSESDVDLAIKLQPQSEVKIIRQVSNILNQSLPHTFDCRLISDQSDPIFLHQSVWLGQCLYATNQLSRIKFEVFVEQLYLDDESRQQIIAQYLPQYFQSNKGNYAY